MSLTTGFGGSEEGFDGVTRECSGVHLRNWRLWSQFHELQTEMIITKSGRRMFPPLEYHLTDLNPDTEYNVLLHFRTATPHRLKYSATGGGWTPAGPEEAQSHHRMFQHPESPASGAHWMAQGVNFHRVKLTNSSLLDQSTAADNPEGLIVLNSMHRYRARVIVVNAETSERVAVGDFEETQFVAVTAYQNEKITKLKIENNPFAKGFRENGKSTLAKKRKRQRQSDDESNDNERDSDTSDVIVVDDDRLSPPPQRQPTSRGERGNVIGPAGAFYCSYPSFYCPPAFYYHPYYCGFDNFSWLMSPSSTYEGRAVRSKMTSDRGVDDHRRQGVKDFTIKSILC